MEGSWVSPYCKPVTLSPPGKVALHGTLTESARLRAASPVKKEIDAP